MSLQRTAAQAHAAVRTLRARLPVSNQSPALPSLSSLPSSAREPAWTIDRARTELLALETRAAAWMSSPPLSLDASIAAEAEQPLGRRAGAVRKLYSAAFRRCVRSGAAASVVDEVYQQYYRCVFPNVIDEFLLSCVHARDGNLEAVARQVRLVERLAGADSIYAHRSVNVLLAACILRAASKSASSSIDTARVQVVLTHMRQRCLPVDAEVLLRLMRELIAAHRIQDACAYLTKIIEWNIIPLDSKPVDSTSSWIDSAAFALIRSLVQPGNSQSQDDASHLNQRAAAAQFVLRNLPPVSNPSNRASQKSSHNSAFFALLNQHVSTDAAQASVKSAFPPFVATASLHQSDTSMHFALESPTSSASLSFSSDVSISAAFDSSTSAACLQNVSLTLRPRDSALPVNALDFVQASRTRLYNTCAALFIRHQLGDVAAWLMTAVSAASPQLLNSYSVSSLVDALITSHQHRLGRLPLIELVQRHVQTMQALSIEPECSSTSQLAKSRSRELRGSAAQLRAAAFARGPLALASIFAQLSLQSSKLAALQPSDEFGNTRAFLRAVDTRLVERLLSNAAAAGDLPSAQRLWSALLRACKSDTMPIDLSATMFSNLLMAHVRGGQIAAAASWLYRSAQALRQAPVELTTEQRLLHACRPDTFTLNTLMAHVLDSNSSTTTEKVPMPVLADDSVDSTFDWSTLSMTSTTESSDVTFAPSPQRNTISAEMPLPLTNISSSAAVQNRSVESVTSPAVGKSAAVKPVRNRLTADLLGLSDTAASIAQPLHCIIPLFSALLPSSQVAAAATASVFLSQQSATTVDNNALSLAACLHKASSNDVLGRQSRLERVFRVLTSAPFNVAPDTRSFTMLLRGAAFACDLRSARRCLREMRRRALAADEAVLNGALHVLLRLAGLCLWHDRRLARISSGVQTMSTSAAAAFATSAVASNGALPYSTVTAQMLSDTRGMLATEAQSLVAAYQTSCSALPARSTYLLLQVLLATGRVDAATRLVLDRNSSQSQAVHIRQTAVVARLLRRSDLERALNAALRADVALQGTVINSPALNRYERHTQAATNTSAALNRML